MNLNLCRRSLGDLATEFHDHNVVRQLHHKVHVVLDQQHSHALGAQFFEQFGQRLFFLVTQTGGRFIEQ